MGKYDGATGVPTRTVNGVVYQIVGEVRDEQAAHVYAQELAKQGCKCRVIPNYSRNCHQICVAIAEEGGRSPGRQQRKGVSDGSSE